MKPARSPWPPGPAPMPILLGFVAGIGASMALAATYWDDAWHTDKGRDEFAIPPHLLLYGGVLVTSLSVLGWAIRSWRTAGPGRLRAMTRDPALLIAGIGGFTTLVSAPIDNAWHALYGRDAVIWSPPHLLAVAGTLGLSAGVLAGLRSSVGVGGNVARLFAAAGVIGALQAPVLEYDSDVPQFSTLWYLPVATFGLCVALALIDDLWPGRWRPLQAAVLYTVMRSLVAVALPAWGFSGSSVPPLVLPVAVAAAASHLPLRLRLLVVGAITPLLWWPAVRLQEDLATRVPLDQLPAATILAVVGAAVVGWFHGDWMISKRGRTVAIQAALLLALPIAVLGVAPGRAWAHDPGQGEERSVGLLTVKRAVGQASVELRIPGSCNGLKPTRSVARRAGVVLTGSLRSEAGSGSSCRFVGHISGLREGRWFIYVELRDSSGREVEGWLPSVEGSAITAQRSLYEPPPVESTLGRDVAGAVMLLAVAGLIIACLRLSRGTVPLSDQPGSRGAISSYSMPSSGRRGR